MHKSMHKIYFMQNLNFCIYYAIINKTKRKGIFMLRRFKKEDKNEYFELATLFYNSDAVLHPVPHSHLENTTKIFHTRVHAVAFG